MLAHGALTALEKEGHLLAGTARPLWISQVVAAVPEGSPVPALDTEADPKTLRTELDRIRREQVFVSDRQLSESTVAVAAPVRIGRNGPVSASLGIVITARSADRARGLREPLLRAAYGISDELGRRTHPAD
ncbi:IclR family transcriptional regulator domain-containing protein [Streptomyces sp. MS191]|uniref:IclR family transcriptional regulator domain-containing protein n=1 Tax=Streptomyces sp. ms191 TaxID=1827978 RepID=UPI0021C804B5|nr:IclR family transcriptional regulator C-terminal domain-containing protein [Streptomyces sp. ms191]